MSEIKKMNKKVVTNQKKIKKIFLKKENYGCVEITEFQLACQIKITPKMLLVCNFLTKNTFKSYKNVILY